MTERTLIDYELIAKEFLEYIKKDLPASTTLINLGAIIEFNAMEAKRIYELGQQPPKSEKVEKAKLIISKLKSIQAELNEYQMKWPYVPMFLGDVEYVKSSFGDLGDLLCDDFVKATYENAASNNKTLIEFFEHEIEIANHDSKNARGFSHFVGMNLALLYKSYFNEEPGYTRKTYSNEEPEYTPDSVEDEYTGQFISFVRFILNRADVKYPDQNIAQALSRMRKKRPLTYKSP